MRIILDKASFKATLERMQIALRSMLPNSPAPAFIGIHTRGIPLAQRLIKSLNQKDILFGVLDINLYRDDLSLSAENPVLRETRIDFDVTGRTVVLVDDVLFTGRTIRAAMDAIFDHGRPARIILAVMAERNGRELPVQADIVGVHVDTQAGDNVKVYLEEIDGEDSIAVKTV